jgi:hypothetical protein
MFAINDKKMKDKSKIGLLTRTEDFRNSGRQEKAGEEASD